MSITDDITALGKDPTNPDDARATIALVVTSPEDRLRLVREWETASGLHLTPEQLTALGIHP